MFALHCRGRVITGEIAEGLAELEFARGAIDPQQLRTGLAVWKADDPAAPRSGCSGSFAGEIRGREVDPHRGGDRSRRRTAATPGRAAHWIARL
ncbi:MAG: hypothetical protein U0992_15645 [Planctomycetaceae bacterium]